MAESDWLCLAPEALPGLLCNRLRSAGWEATRINAALRFPAGRPMLRLLHPVRMQHGERHALSGHSSWVVGCAISPDGQRVVSASLDSTLKVWDPATGQLLSTLQDCSGAIGACAISPDGQRIVSASGYNLNVWSAATGQLLTTLVGHLYGVNACAINPDGRLAFSASDDMTLRVWDLITAKCLMTVHGVSSFHCVAASSQLLCAGDALGSLWLLELDSASLSTQDRSTALR